jgi:hypothetical protein
VEALHVGGEGQQARRAHQLVLAANLAADLAADLSTGFY